MKKGIKVGLICLGIVLLIVGIICGIVFGLNYNKKEHYINNSNYLYDVAGTSVLIKFEKLGIWYPISFGTHTSGTYRYKFSTKTSSGLYGGMEALVDLYNT